MNLPSVSEDGAVHGKKCIVVHPQIRDRSKGDAEARLEEACGLARAIDLDVADGVIVTIRQPRAATLFGAGQVGNISTLRMQHDADLVIVDGPLSAIQQRNLEKAFACKVIDRTGLILEIFGERAATAEGRLQVELAHLDYQAGRLVRSWTHLERQRGGYGFLGGPGETQIESDRRMIRERMAQIRRKLEQVRRTRGLHRHRRERAPWPVVALVGYTNAGKSTLFNRLTGATALAQDMLFATLDPTMRAISLPGVGKCILSDTVGFITELPTELVAAFRATLEEVTAANVIVHVRDIANSEAEMQKNEVLDVLAMLGVAGVDDEETPTPIIEAWNKWDLLSDDRIEQLSKAAERRDGPVVPVSALTGEGCDKLLNTVAEVLTKDNRIYEFVIPAADGRRLAWLHSHGRVLAEHPVKDAPSSSPHFRLTVRLPLRERERFDTL